jgi:hypothetical protein
MHNNKILFVNKHVYKEQDWTLFDILNALASYTLLLNYRANWLKRQRFSLVSEVLLFKY